MTKTSKILKMAICALFQFAILTAPTAKAEEAETPVSFEEGIQVWLEDQLEERQIPGIIFAYVKDGEIVLARGFGYADLEAGRPADRDTPFRVGSVSKSLTATAVLHLVNNSEVELSDDMRAGLSELSIRPALEAPLTLHHLLTHTGGFNERLFGQHVSTADEFIGLGTYLERHLPPRFEEPGRVIAYNDHHTMLAGYLLEQLSGESFESYLAANVFKPLGMGRSTFYQVDMPPEIAATMARAYRFVDGAHRPYALDYVLSTPAAGLITTANDMALYMNAILARDDSDPTQLALQFRHRDKLIGRAYGFVASRRNGLRYLYKDGQASGFSARLLLIPEKKIGVFVAQNRSILEPGGSFNSAARLARDFSEQVLGHFAPPIEGAEAIEPTPTGNDTASYVGTYRNVVAARHSWERTLGMSDDLTVTAAGPGRIQIGSGEYIEVEEGLFQWHSGADFYMAFSDEERPGYLFIGAGAYERIPWYGTSSNTPLLAGGFAATFLIGAVFLSVMAWRRRSGPRLRSAPGLAGMAATAKLAFFGGLAAIMMTTDPQLFFKGPTDVLKLVLLLPPAAVVLDLWAAYRLQAEGGWVESSFLRKGGVLIYGLASVGFVLWLEYWKLLGWRFG